MLAMFVVKASKANHGTRRTCPFDNIESKCDCSTMSKEVIGPYNLWKINVKRYTHNLHTSNLFALLNSASSNTHISAAVISTVPEFAVTVRLITTATGTLTTPVVVPKKA